MAIGRANIRECFINPILRFLASLTCHKHAKITAKKLAGNANIGCCLHVVQFRTLANDHTLHASTAWP